MSEELPRLSVDDEDALQHTQRFMAERRADAPVCPVRILRHQDAELVTKYADVHGLLSDERLRHDVPTKAMADAAANQREITPSEHLFYQALGTSMLYRDPPDHTRLRKLVNRTFTPRAVERLRPMLSGVIDDLLGGLDPAGPVDLVTGFGLPLTLFAICELLGVPKDERADFGTWADKINGVERDDAFHEALRTTVDYMSELIEHKRANPGPDLLSELIAVSDADHDRLSGDELVASALLLLFAGHDTTVGLIVNAALCLLRAPDQLAALRADPSLLGNTVEEVLRYECPVNLMPARLASEPVPLPDGTIREGELVLLSILSANRDEEKFPGSDRFDVTRPATGHVAFGHGIHYCPGAPLARLEGSLAIEALVTRFPKLRLAVDPDRIVWRASTLMHRPDELLVRID